ncbi:MAG: 2-phosphosulfolactate phosphatase [Longimicrobiales bacterium]
MRVDIAFTPAELAGGGVGERTVVVIDVLRASTTILEALVNGAREVLPVESVEQAVRRREEIGKRNVLLCGERDTQPIAGFDLGNSPLEFVRERVDGETLVMTTTNGTRALLAGASGKRCVVGCFLNAGAVAKSLADAGDDTLLLCAGREGRFALEDALCAGLIARRVGRLRPDDAVEGNDASLAAMRLAARIRRELPATMSRTAAGRRLAELGRQDDVDFCGTLDRYTEIPRVRERRISL